MVSILLFVEITGEMRSILLGGRHHRGAGRGGRHHGPARPAEIRGADHRGPGAALNGVTIQAFSNPNVFSDNAYWVLGNLSVPLTVLWIVAITNS